MPYLNCQLGSGNYVEYELPSRPITIGRAGEADLQIADERVSRIHCGIRAEGGVYFIKDLGSTNGTWVNDTRIHEARLHFGDTIRVGHTLIVFEAAPRRRDTSRMPEVIEVELPSQSFEQTLHQIVDEASHRPEPRAQTRSQ